MILKASYDNFMEDSAGTSNRSEFLASITTRFPAAPSSAAAASAVAAVTPVPSASMSGVVDMDVDADIPSGGQETKLPGMLGSAVLQC